MFKFLKRLASGQSRPDASPGRSAAKVPREKPRRRTAPAPLGPLPIPEVREANDESVWDEWEHSKMELDSRLGAPSAYDSIQVKDSPSQAADLDPFAAVRKRS